jgi:iron complex outermembrane recepter protein
VFADYTWRLASNIAAFLRGDFEYTGLSNGSYIQPVPGAPNPAFIDPAYNVANVSVGASISNLELSVFAKNLFNDRTILQSPMINSVVEGYTLRPLTVGISFQAKLP